jgi:tetratricopeptide (TPR) repeat protein
VPENGDLSRLRDDWLATRDGVTGARYAEALRIAGEVDAALAVCRDVADLGFAEGYLEWAWLEHGRGDVDRAIAVMEEVAALVEDETERRYALGVAGHWRWESRNDVTVEPMLRTGMADYQEARVDLAHLLMATGRRAEGVRTLSDGVQAGQVACLLPLANILSEDGEHDTAEGLYRRAFDAGDTNAAWNLAVLLWETDRGDEAQQWVWRAAESGDDVAIGYLADVEPEDLDRR